MNNLENTSNESIDQGWFNEIKPLAFDSFEYLVPNKESMAEQKSLFMAGEIDSPNFFYPKLQAHDLDEKERSLLALKGSLVLDKDQRKKKLDKREDVEVAKQAYHWRINQMIAEVRMLKSSLDKNFKKFQRYSEFVYGKPEERIFDYIVDFTTHQTGSVKDQDSELGKSAQALEEVLPKNDEVPEIQNPTDETFKRVSDFEEEEINELVEIPIQEYLSAEDISAGFQQALEKLQAEGWGVIIDNESGRTAVSVSQAEKKVYVPGSAKMSRMRFCELVAHEIGTHVVRRLNGERSKLMLLGIGLDRYDPGDEGLAIMKEQIFRGTVEGYTKHGLYLGISLAYGLDGRDKKGFRDVYNALFHYNKFLFLTEGQKDEEVEKKAKNTAWVQTVRIFRGTNGSAGTCFTKDLAYLEGNIGVWEVVDKNDDELHRFNVGKYNPANDRHIAILDRLGISDADLKTLEEEE